MDENSIFIGEVIPEPESTEQRKEQLFDYLGTDKIPEKKRPIIKFMKGDRVVHTMYDSGEVQNG